ncbi:hypothetical protein NCS57_01313500 [Fusarium keratoplasticum]|uniref:Uncharacterized protein n=1 Tax=Fusarium keratoplasticum TaxID=1328300 RepID=A0ACC0QES5_9HYPO|nr:hypothetical protein NCS57_01313500 [Fusarium keratoplasticum]KAI8652494.1 hypothetical protein NCS57_01313500 [Fusarium keratoplasticum]KAI8653224.1 hypothetical protein NCS55_01307100 [Fusarium keratoplasticum]
MDPASLAFGVIAIFKDTYLTAKFIETTIKTIKIYHDEQSRMVMHFTVQIYRLKNLSRLFRAADGNSVDMTLLETVPDEYLNLVRSVLGQLQQVLAEYAKLAATLDEDYKRFSPLSPHFKFDPVKDSLKIDDASNTGKIEEPADGGDGKSDNPVPVKSKWWPFRGFGLGNSKGAKSPKKLTSLKNLPPGLQWVFTKGELEQTLKKFEEWNRDLEYLIAPLLDGFGFYGNADLRERLRPDGDGKTEVNLFQGHVDLNMLAADPGGKSGDARASKENFISCREAEAKAAQPRILVEFKKMADKGDTRLDNMAQPVKELYGPQLARLLHTAGNYSFRTLPFNSYSWDAKETQYTFLFDYPPGTSDLKPKSLNDFMLSSSNESYYKLELKQRFHVAQTVARAIGAFHSDGWLHKSIRSHAIKFFFLEDDDKCDFANPYLTDFEFSRPVAGMTRLAPGAVDVDHEVYRHPDRHGSPSTNFNMTHDIYSLGVVLLEIGLWQTARQIYDDIVKYELGGDAAKVTALTIKNAFLQDAKERLAHRMGSAYQEAVVACLDDDWEELVGSRDFANEFQRRVVQKVDIRAFIG